mgnify:CR=1 FL=1
MFEVGFSELLMTGLVALIVIGPEKLPKAARVAGLWWGRVQRSLTLIKSEISQELHAEEMRQLMQQNSIGQDMQRMVEDVKTSIAEIEQDVKAPSHPTDFHDPAA